MELLAPIELTLMSAAVDSLLRDVAPSTTICVQFLGGPLGPIEAPAAFLEKAAARHEVVRARDCPRTYASMFARVDSLGRSLDPPRPPGYVDPVRLSVGRPQFDQPGYAFLYARQMQGMSGKDHLCVVQAYGSRTQAGCRVLTHWVH